MHRKRIERVTKYYIKPFLFESTDFFAKIKIHNKFIMDNQDHEETYIEAKGSNLILVERREIKEGTPLHVYHENNWMDGTIIKYQGLSSFVFFFFLFFLL